MLDAHKERGIRNEGTFDQIAIDRPKAWCY